MHPKCITPIPDPSPLGKAQQLGSLAFFAINRHDARGHFDHVLSLQGAQVMVTSVAGADVK